MTNLLYFVLLYAIILAVLLLKDMILPDNTSKNSLKYWTTLLCTVLIVVLLIYLLQNFTVEGFHFEVSAKRQCGMLEHVLPTNNSKYFMPSLNYPLQGDGITCAKPFVGHNGDLTMNVGEWKRGGDLARPDFYLPNATNTVPPMGNCGCSSSQSGNFPQVKENFNENLKSQIQDLGIVFYQSSGCGFCTKAKEMFKDYGIDMSDFVAVKDASELPEGVNGVPHFASQKTGKTHTGYPGSVEKLVEKLSVTENYEPRSFPSEYYGYQNYVQPGQQVLETLACTGSTCPKKNKSGTSGVAFV